MFQDQHFRCIAEISNFIERVMMLMSRLSILLVQTVDAQQTTFFNHVGMSGVNDREKRETSSKRGCGMAKEMFWEDSWLAKDIGDVHGPCIVATMKVIGKLDAKIKTAVGASASKTLTGRDAMPISATMVMKTLAPAAHGVWQSTGTCWWIVEEILLVGFFAEDATIIEDGAATDDFCCCNNKGLIC